MLFRSQRGHLLCPLLLHTPQLPGDRFTQVEDLVPCLDSYAAAGFEMKPKYRKMAKQYFRYRDNHNSRRIYQFLKSNGY